MSLLRDFMALAKDSFKDSFKSDAQREQEKRTTKTQALSAIKSDFLLMATEKGFTQEQAEFMATYLSLSGHFHNYVSGLHWRTTE